ncbi:BTAD domain-containing putative transcriptional regulator [Catenulispora rubra]|uniref:BTAD domain-containing putative transcriptional regulator n=1 Tax=Catenulispora rubra TaxID=280293 RepID=UPI001892600D|nr:BTAD domain-containing putative transcriptional regulator [Catenulispora rubra]
MVGKAHTVRDDDSPLRRAREAAGISQKELAGRAGMSVRALRYLEDGQVAKPRAVSIHRLARALDLTAEELAERLAQRLAEPAPARPRPGPGGVGVRQRPVPAPAGRIRIRVLGRFTILRGDVVVEMNSPLQQAVLGLLAVRHGRVVTVQDLVDALWYEDPPRTCRELVHTYIGQVRRVLEPESQAGERGRLLRSTGGGYLLTVDPEQLDLAAFDRLAEQGRRAWERGAATSACQLFGESWACWQGTQVLAGDTRLSRHPDVAGVQARRTSLLLDWSDAAFSVGRYAQVAEPLRDAHGSEPLHEDVAARLMLALTGTGRQAAALALFEEVRALLDAELGVSPGAGLRAAQLRILRDRLPGPVERPAPAVPTPAQLPAEPVGFVGRREHLDRLDAIMTEHRSGQAATGLIVLTGMGGLGKTMLALRWAHRVLDRFPDGQLHVDLRGHSGSESVRPHAALSGFLTALGVPPAQVPEGVEQAAALYRSLLAGKRVLVLLDNAGRADQIRPLVPAGGSLVLATSRHRMTGLVARDGARMISLDALAPREALALLEGMIGTPRIVREPQAAAELVQLCARLPLALSIAAANLAARPHLSLADYARTLKTDNRLDALETADDPDAAVRAAFALSVDALPPAEGRMFRLLGAVPGFDVATGTAAAVAGVSRRSAAQALIGLADRHLVQERGADRFAMHDLVRLFASELADGDAESAEATARLAQHHLARLESVADALYPHLLHLPDHGGSNRRKGLSGLNDPTGPSADDVPAFPDPAAALAWINAERANLVALVPHLVGQGSAASASAMADLMTGYFMMRSGTADWAAVAQAARGAARLGDDPRAVAAAELSIAMVDVAQGRHASAARRFGRTAVVAERAGWTECQAVALNNLGSALWTAGRVEEALAALEQALQLHRACGRAAGEAVSLANLGAAHLDRGALLDAAEPDDVRAARLATAEAFLTAALTMHRQIGDHRNEADTLTRLAQASRERDDLRAALELAQAAIDTARSAGDLRFEAAAEGTAATVSSRLRDDRSALEHIARANALVDSIDHPPLAARIYLLGADTCLSLGRWEDASLYVEDAQRVARLVTSPMLERQCLIWTNRIQRYHETAMADMR